MTPGKTEACGDAWRRFDAAEQRLSAPLTARMLELGKPGDSKRAAEWERSLTIAAN